MRSRVSLRTRIYLILGVLLFITIAGGLVMVWYTYRMETLLTQIIDKNVAAFQAAEALENALVNQKGFVSYYFLDGDPEWLRQLGEYRQIFKARLDDARALIETEEQRQAIDRIESEYLEYVKSKDQVIGYYKTGRRETGALLHKDVRKRFFRILELSEQYKGLHENRIRQVMKTSQAEARRLRLTAASAILIALFLAVLLAFVLVKQVLGPVRRLAMEASRDIEFRRSGNEVKALSRSVRDLIDDMDQTHSELEKSREHLLQAEKMALVGKLAAGTAHSIRNPLTSVKMRLFSLARTLELSPPQKEDFDVISQEIRHIDTIVQNFLEFSRPPKLKMQQVSPSDVVDMVIQLLRHRLESYQVDIKVVRQRRLPEIQADPEQLKEVLINLVENACESMEGGGDIVIREQDGFNQDIGSVVTIQVTDNGSGIPESIQYKVFEPFFTMKEEGTGLGLSIALRIVEEHGGRLDLVSKEGEGSTFTITLPLKGVGIEHHLGH